MLFDVSLDMVCLVVRCFVDEEDYPPEVMPFGICYNVVQVFSELDIPSA